MKKISIPFFLAGFVVVLDQLIKLLVSSRFSFVGTKVLIPHVLEFHYLENTGAAMGMFAGARWPLIVVTLLLIIGCSWYLIRKPNLGFFLRYGLALIIGGGIGNLIDRMFIGYVVDFIRFPISWFNYSFNIADCAVCIGVAMIFLDFIIELFHEQKSKGNNDGTP